MSSDQGSLFGKTSQEFSRRTITPLAASWRGLSVLMKPSYQSQTRHTQNAGGHGGNPSTDEELKTNGLSSNGARNDVPVLGQVRVWCLDRQEQQRGVSWMPNISEWPNDAHVCSLFSVLETVSIPPKYYLSSKACAGILRRAEKRGKTLPATLSLALMQVAQAQLKDSG